MIARMLTGTSVALMIVVVLTAMTGGQSSYNISVALDETTRGDLDVVAASLENATPGAEVQRSLRRLVAGAAGELALLASQRVDENGTLTLDDGSFVLLAPDDEVVVSASGESHVEFVAEDGTRKHAARRRVVIIRPPCNSGSCSMKPLAILIATNAGCRRVLLFSHPPLVGTC